jgi:hypothetical protein
VFTAAIYNDLSIEEGILNFAKGIDADLIAMATHGRTGFFHVVNGSLTEDIVNHTTFPGAECQAVASVWPEHTLIFTQTISQPKHEIPV